MKGLRKIMKDLRCPSEDLNWALTEYKSHITAWDTSIDTSKNSHHLVKVGKITQKWVM
jgi:hypothetical protein